ncbi:MAG: prolyl oligopeptidase family serine peptidase, partial [Gaiellales bacterium]
PNDIDVEDMLARSDELSTFVREATAEHQLDPDRIVALGYSNGANIALATLLAQPQLFHAAVLLRPVLYHKPDPLPELSGMDILALAGARDPYTPPEVLEELASVLEQCHANLDLQVNAAAGHQLAQADLVHAARWTEGLLARIDAGDRSAT